MDIFSRKSGKRSILSTIVSYVECILDLKLIRSVMANNAKPPPPSLSMILKEEPYLCDLHTHLMGMGNANFWIDTILMDESVMPPNVKFNDDLGIRKAFGPLVWNKTDGPNGSKSGFVKREETAEFFDYLVRKNVFRTEPEPLFNHEASNQLLEPASSTEPKPINDEDTTEPLPEEENSDKMPEEAGSTESKKPISYEEAMAPLRIKFPTLSQLVTEDLYNDLFHGGLEFKDDFSYDVILTLEDLRKGLGIRNSNCEGFLQLAVTEKLGGHLQNRSMNSGDFDKRIEDIRMKSDGSEIFNDLLNQFKEYHNLQDRSIKLQHWIVFNARKQKFDIVYGMQVERLRKLIYIDPNKPSEAAKLARAHLINAFSMCDAEGNRPRPIDFHSFHGFFTPEFYPRRFALKDSIYSQRLDVLAALIGNIMERYRTCIPIVKYCELSVSANDLSKQWVFDVLRSFRFYDTKTIDDMKDAEEPNLYVAQEQLSSFTQVVVNGSFPYVLSAFKSSQDRPDPVNVNYKFLAGFDRQKIRSPFPTNQEEALHYLYRAPHEAILLMWNEIKKTRNDKRKRKQVWADLETCKDIEEENEKIFDPCFKQLRLIRQMGEDVPYFYKWVVGLDLFGDELGYPYCPFVARPFIEYVLERRGEGRDKGRNKDNDIYFNKYFGMRVHGGENVKYADHDNPAYRLFIAHMYIVFRSLLFLQQKLRYGIRIGHGIAFNHILSANLSTPRHRKSSVLLAEMHALAKILFRKIAFEVNLTSNEYLLGQSLRGGDFKQILCLGDLFQMDAPITLSTDDDGIWPIDQCPVTHPGHQSLAAEYCRAISTSLIETEKNLRWTFETMKKFCFQNMGYDKQEEFVDKATRIKCPPMNNLIVHPHIISLIIEIYRFRGMTPNPAIEKYNVYTTISGEPPRKLEWVDDYAPLRVAFVCICAKRNPSNKKQLRAEYQELFRDRQTRVKEFDFIFNNWKNIYKDFVLRTSKTCLKLQIDYPDQSTRNNLVLSMDSPSDDFSEFLKDICWSGAEIDIRAYANEASAKHMKETFSKYHGSAIKKNITEQSPHGGTFYLYTNTDKYTYAYDKVKEGFQLRLNPRASRREPTEQNFIYVLCHHSRAATAALGLIGKQLRTLADHSEIDLACIKPETVASNVKPFTTAEFVQNMEEKPPQYLITNRALMKITANEDVSDGKVPKQARANDSDHQSEAKRQCIEQINPKTLS